MPGRYNLRKRGAQSTTWVKDETLKQPDSESEDEDYVPPSESEEEEAADTEDEEESEDESEEDESEEQEAGKADLVVKPSASSKSATKTAVVSGSSQGKSTRGDHDGLSHSRVC